MFSPWFHVDHLPSPGGTWLLSRDEAKHATGSKRLGAGDSVILFDGKGGVVEAVLGDERTRDGALVVRVVGTVEASWQGRRIRLACALPKGDRLSTLVDMTTQLGVAGFAPLRCERSVVSETDARTDRIRRIQVESCKQARWPWVPELETETTPQSLARRCADDGIALVVAHPGGEPAATIRAALDAGAAPREPRACAVCIGPEGGFTEREVDELRAAGGRLIDLGPSVLRIETAAVAALALLR